MSETNKFNGESPIDKTFELAKTLTFLGAASALALGMPVAARLAEAGMFTAVADNVRKSRKE